MKYIKKFEYSNDDETFEIGNYVICTNPEYNTHINSKILTGVVYKVVDIKNFGDNVYPNINIKLEGQNVWYSNSRFIHATPEDIEKYEMAQDIKKYNL